MRTLKPIHRPRIVIIEGVKTETLTTKSFMFHDSPCASASPGQFVMVWLPGVDEIPMSLSTISRRGYVAITARSVGEATKHLHGKRVGDMLGIRGPYGVGFTIGRKRRTLVAGGGTGLAALMPLIERLALAKNKITAVVGARTKSELLFLDRIKSVLSSKGSLTITTDDGTCGTRGLVSEAVEESLQAQSFDLIYTCGPEPMIRRIFDAAKERGIPIQASLERIMRCGVGICGSCCVGKYRVCKEGPVFSQKQLLEVADEFGVYRRDFSGKAVRIEK